MDSSLNNIAGKETGQTQDLDKWESKSYPGKGKDCARNAKSKNGRGDNSGPQTLGFNLLSSLEFLLKAEGFREMARMKPVLNWWKSGGKE